VKPLALDDILDIDRYEAVRPAYRSRVIEHKRARRVAVGDRVTISFEDRETLRYQIQEMTRIEQSRGAVRIQAELDAYNDLMPADGELSATLFIEITDMESIRPELDRLIGIDEHVALVLGEDLEGEVVRARFDPKQMEEERISAVQYIRFGLSPAQIERVARGDRVRLRIDHPQYAAEADLSPETRASLLRDLRDDPPDLLDLRAVPEAPETREEVVGERGAIRILRPGPRQRSGHRILELASPGVALRDVDAGHWNELLPVLREVVAEIAGGSGGFRIWAEVEPTAPLRIHVSAGPDTDAR